MLGWNALQQHVPRNEMQMVDAPAFLCSPGGDAAVFVAEKYCRRVETRWADVPLHDGSTRVCPLRQLPACGLNDSAFAAETQEEVPNDAEGERGPLPCCAGAAP